MLTHWPARGVRRRTPIAPLAVALVLVAAACSSNAASPTAATPTPAPAQSSAAQTPAPNPTESVPSCGTGPVVLRAFFETGFDIPFKLSDEFTKQFPNVTWDISQ